MGIAGIGKFQLIMMMKMVMILKFSADASSKMMMIRMVTTKKTDFG